MAEHEAFLLALTFTLKHEGGYVNHPSDPGGATMKGITQATYDAFRRSRKLPTLPVRAIAEQEVRAIYHDRYWLANNCDRLPARVAIALFDFAVNAGNQGARKLQASCGVAVDGKIGPQSIAAVTERTQTPFAEGLLVGEYIMRRRLFYDSLIASRPSLQVFADGWTNRVDALVMYLMEVS